MTSDVVLGNALKGTLRSINRTQDTIDDITQRLASGLKVNSALDQPQNFFASRALQDTAGDYSRLLDGIGQSVRTIQEGLNGVETVSQLLDQAEAVVRETEQALIAGEVDPAVYEKEVNSSPPALSLQISNSAPDTYFRLNETGGPIIDSGALGPIGANYAGGASANAPALYTNGAAPSVNFDGANDRIRVNDAAHINTSTTTARTVELVFNADDVTGRQVLYEEGATVNGFTIYLDGDVVYVTGEDDQGGQQWNDANVNSTQISAADGGPVNIVAGQTYHVAFVYDAATDSFSGYLDGVLMNSVNTDGAANFPSHSGDIGIGAVNGGVQFHDGENGAGNGFNFDGRISDVAIYNRALDISELASHANSLEATTSIVFKNREYDAILEQLELLTIDAHYRGINLLQGEDLTTIFNPERSSTLVTEGQDFRKDALGLLDTGFDDLDTVQLILESIREAREDVRAFGASLTNELGIIQTRLDFTRQYINLHKAGSDDLVVADQNKEGADLIASQTRLALGTASLALAGLSQRSILQVLR